jgi:hypothetical protein
MIRRLIAAAGALLLAGAAFGKNAQPISLKWNELGPEITGKKVALILPDGTAVQGKVRGVDSTGLQLKISKTSDRRAQPKGLHTIPRASVTLLQVTGYRKIARVAFTVGAVAAAAPFVAMGFQNTAEGPLAVAVPVAGIVGVAGLGVGGYYFGKAVDKRVVLIRVVPGD